MSKNDNTIFFTSEKDRIANQNDFSVVKKQFLFHPFTSRKYYYIVDNMTLKIHSEMFQYHHQ